MGARIASTAPPALMNTLDVAVEGGDRVGREIDDDLRRSRRVDRQTAVDLVRCSVWSS
jgi:hypothetical protein